MPAHPANPIFFQIALILLGAKVVGEICERWLKQPPVLGEILYGVLIGKSGFGWLNENNQTLISLAEIGAVFLLFEVGLESDRKKLFKTGGTAFYVACVGVVLPFLFGYLAAINLHYAKEALFIGAALTATSVGITARIFTDMKATETREAQVVLGAAVADDVIGLIILAAISQLKGTSWFYVGKLTFIALLFLFGAICIGPLATPFLLKWANKMQIRAAVSSTALVFCLLLATLAQKVQLAPLVGAFAAGLILAEAEHKIHFEVKMKSIGEVFVPIFFVMMGVSMDLKQFDMRTPVGYHTVQIGVALLVVAIAGKLISGLTTPGRGLKRWIIGVGMIPRGEVGLVFASLGLQNKIIGPDLYAALIFVVVGTTFIAPPLIGYVLRPSDKTKILPPAVNP